MSFFKRLVKLKLLFQILHEHLLTVFIIFLEDTLTWSKHRCHFMLLGVSSEVSNCCAGSSAPHQCLTTLGIIVSCSICCCFM